MDLQLVKMGPEYREMAEDMLREWKAPVKPSSQVLLIRQTFMISQLFRQPGAYGGGSRPGARFYLFLPG